MKKTFIFAKNPNAAASLTNVFAQNITSFKSVRVLSYPKASEVTAILGECDISVLNQFYSVELVMDNHIENPMELKMVDIVNVRTRAVINFATQCGLTHLATQTLEIE